jgi:holo-[acyl-carrier protein] synthase
VTPLDVGVGKRWSHSRRIERALSLCGDCFIQRVFTPDEQQVALLAKAAWHSMRGGSQPSRLAQQPWLPGGHGLRRRDMSVIILSSGRPAITLSSNASARLRDLSPEAHDSRIDLTFTDDFPFAGANVIILGRREMADRR